MKENQFQAATRAPRPPVQWQKASTMRPSDNNGRLYSCQRAPLRSLVPPPLSSDLPYITLLLLPPHPPPPPPTPPPPPLIIGQARRARREAEATASARARCMFAPQPRGHLGPPRGPIHPIAATPDAVGLLVRKARRGYEAVASASGGARTNGRAPRRLPAGNTRPEVEEHLAMRPRARREG